MSARTKSRARRRNSVLSCNLSFSDNIPHSPQVPLGKSPADPTSGLYDGLEKELGNVSSFLRSIRLIRLQTRFND